ncbi:MAG: hypothetical protein K8S25_10945 [Alphaproteobacteria bacterium]|nr:hypothetical protein [Alphaproteobacteria bacterium]
MGFFNTLHAVVPCSKCGQSAKRDIQFKYGDSRMNEFEVGQFVGWNVNVRGQPWAGVALTAGTAGQCATCNADFLDYIIELRGDKLVAVWPRTEADDPYWNDLDNNYAIHFDDSTADDAESGPRVSLRATKWTVDNCHD